MDIFGGGNFVIKVILKLELNFSLTKSSDVLKLFSIKNYVANNK